MMGVSQVPSAAGSPQAPPPPHARPLAGWVLGFLLVVGVVRRGEERNVIKAHTAGNVAEAAGGTLNVKGQVSFSGGHGWGKEGSRNGTRRPLDALL